MPPDKRQKARAAVDDARKVVEALRAAEYGKWEGFYSKGDLFVNVRLTLALAEAYQGMLEGRPVPESLLAAAEPYQGYPVDSSPHYRIIKAYQDKQQVQF